jgi:hypothetical protein
MAAGWNLPHSKQNHQSDEQNFVGAKDDLLWNKQNLHWNKEKLLSSSTDRRKQPDS